MEVEDLDALGLGKGDRGLDERLTNAFSPPGFEYGNTF
jgi:hypothetical protein